MENDKCDNLLHDKTFMTRDTNNIIDWTLNIITLSYDNHTHAS